MEGEATAWPEGPTPAPAGENPPRVPAGATAGFLAGWLTVAAGMGWLVAVRPELFQLDVPLGIPGLLGGAALLGLCVVLVERPGFALLVLVALVFLNLSEVLVRFHGLPSLLQIVALPLLAAGLLARDSRVLARAATHPLTLLLLGYGSLVLLSSTAAWEPALAEERLVDVSKAFGLYLLVALLGSTSPRLRSAAWCLVGCGVLLAALGVHQATTGGFDQTFGGLARVKNAQIYGDVFAPRIAGPVGDPNFFAQILLIPLPVALLLAWETEGRRLRILAWSGATLILAAIILTYSRGATLALGAVALLVLLVRGLRWREVAMVGAGLGLLLLLSPAGFGQRLTTLSQLVSGEDRTPLHLDSSFEERRLLTATAWRMFLDQPVLGVGAGNYTVRYDDYAERVGSSARDYGEPSRTRYPHSLYLEIGAETGAAGLLVFGSAVLVAMASLIRARRRLALAGDRTSAAVAAGLAVALVGYLVSSLFLHGHFQRYLWLVFGLAAAFDLLPDTAASGGRERGTWWRPAPVSP